LTWRVLSLSAMGCSLSFPTCRLHRYLIFCSVPLPRPTPRPPGVRVLIIDRNLATSVSFLDTLNKPPPRPMSPSPRRSVHRSFPPHRRPGIHFSRVRTVLLYPPNLCGSRSPFFSFFRFGLSSKAGFSPLGSRPKIQFASSRPFSLNARVVVPLRLALLPVLTQPFCLVLSFPEEIPNEV